jgi:N-acetylglucosamine kinase-like BadF-type ATPase
LNAKKSLLVAAVVATVGVSGALLPTLASAETSNTDTSLVDKIAQKFNLKTEDVQAVFDQEKSERQAEKQQAVANRLQKAVDDGKITAEQKTLIENKMKELQTARDAEMKELQTWAEDNKINAKFLMMGAKMGGNSDHLQDAVDAGTITAEQKTLIENKQKELQAKREAARTALQKWAEDNKIDMSYLKQIRGGGHELKKHF